jgi:hypothetical protein
MSGRRVAAAVPALGVTVALLICVGRWEQRREVRQEIAGMRAVLAAIGPLDQVSPTGYRVGPPDCLAYPISKNALGLQVCFDRDGRVVETVDRRGLRPIYASLAYDPSLSTLRGSPTRIAALLAATVKASTGQRK